MSASHNHHPLPRSASLTREMVEAHERVFLAERTTSLRSIFAQRVAAKYDRKRTLPHLLGCTAEEAERADPNDAILALELAYRAERFAVRTRHWSRLGYGRCPEFRAALKAERALAERRAAA